jgi:type II secretory ATPase GspE/PulE/Tfp pilus assembly ATPase PilB-like protein
LRAALRQDPDVIMVGEIRDKETLDMAMEAAMTGHLVFSTIHTNSSAETITRVMNLGAQAFMVSGTFNLVMAQRLTRKICSDCQQQIDSHDEEEYAFARDSFAHFDKAKLKEEINHRGITHEQRDLFVNQGKTFIGT